MKKKLVFVALMALVLSVTGCGSGETSTDESSTASETDTGSSVSVSVQDIKDRGTLVIGGEMTYEPYEYLDENDEYTGYDIEIWQYIANDLGVELEIVDLPFSGALTGLDAGKYDVVGCVVGVNAERAKSYEFSIPVMSSRILAVKSISNSSITSMEDCDGLTVGAQVGSTAEICVNEWNDELTAAGGGFAEIKTYTGTTEAFLDLVNGGVDIACEAEQMVLSLMDKQEGVYEIVGQVGETSYLSYAFRTSDTEFRDFVNEELQKMKEDGTLSALMEKYFEMDIVADLPESDFIPEE